MSDGANEGNGIAASPKQTDQGEPGTIKWFDESKGYGFLVDANNADHYFHVTGVVGADLPSNGDEVRFRPTQGKKGPRADRIILVKRAEKQRDDRVTCSSCDRRMVPRLYYNSGILMHSSCPFCGTLYRRFPGGTFRMYWIPFVIVVSLFVFISLSF